MIQQSVFPPWLWVWSCWLFSTFTINTAKVLCAEQTVDIGHCAVLVQNLSTLLHPNKVVFCLGSLPNLARPRDSAEVDLALTFHSPGGGSKENLISLANDWFKGVIMWPNPTQWDRRRQWGNSERSFSVPQMKAQGRPQGSFPSDHCCV